MTELEVVRSGPSGGPTLVFLHEGLGCVALWRDFPARLAEATRLGALVYSRAGYGRSPPVALPRPLTYMHHEAQVVLPALLAEQGVTDPILVGHSDGGSIAIIYDGFVRARVLLAAHVLCEDVSVRSIEEMRAAYLNGELRARLAKYHRDVDNAFWGWNDAWLDPGFRAWNIEAFLPAITTPVMVIQGEKDPYGTMAQVEAIERGLRGKVERWIVPGCGHAPQAEETEAVLARVAEFVRAS